MSIAIFVFDLATLIERDLFLEESMNRVEFGAMQKSWEGVDQKRGVALVTLMSFFSVFSFSSKVNGIF